VGPHAAGVETPPYALDAYDVMVLTENQDLVVWRVIAGTDDMRVTFDPPAPDPAGSEHYFAQQGDMLEFHAPANSYGYPGGLSVKSINPVPEIE